MSTPYLNIKLKNRIYTYNTLSYPKCGCSEEKLLEQLIGAPNNGLRLTYYTPPCVGNLPPETVIAAVRIVSLIHITSSRFLIF